MTLHNKKYSVKLFFIICYFFLYSLGLSHVNFLKGLEKFDGLEKPKS